jgi:hypothetical protein
MDYDEIDERDFITAMNDSKKYGRIFHIMILTRRLLLELEGRNPDDGPMTLATSLLHPKPRFRLTWNNVADRVPIMRIEANYILRELKNINNRVDMFEPTHNQQKKANSFIISLSNYLTETAATAMPITYNINSNEDSDSDSDTEARGIKKRKRKSIKTKSRKSRKSKKTRKSRKSRKSKKSRR